MASADASMYARKGRRSQTTSLLRRDARSRLEVASKLATRLTTLHDPTEIAQAVVDELHSAFGYYLAAIHRLDGIACCEPSRVPAGWQKRAFSGWLGSSRSIEA